MTITVAAVQLSSQEDVAKNLARAGELVAGARAAGAELVVLPENFAFMGPEEDKRALAEEVSLGDGDAGGRIVSALRAAARASSVWIVAGGFPERSADPERPYNTSLLVGPRGEVVARYRKIHLFDVEVPGGQSYEESRATTAGVEGDLVVADACGTKLGMSVCYDVRFPELYRRLARAGARVVTVPAAFTLMTGKDHWHVLLRARAIENQVWVVAAAQHGKHPRGRQTYGKSLVVDPWGEVVAQASEGEGFCVARVDLAYQDRVRAALPCLSHVRLT